MTQITLIEAINKTLDQEMKSDKSIILLGEDIGVDGGVFRATQGLIDKYPKRVFDTPLAESGILGCSIGMAVSGLRPIPEVQFSGFMYYAFHQIESHMARMRYRSRGRFTLPLVIRTPYGGGIRALEHHSESFEAGYIQTKGIKIVVPSSPSTAKGLLAAAIKDPDPVIFFEPKKLYRAFREEVKDEQYTFPIGKCHIEREGKDITLVAWGSMLRPTLRVADKLKDHLNCEVIDVRTVHPIDFDTIINSVKKTGRCVVVHEAPRLCGLGAEISSQINEKLSMDLLAPVHRVTGFDVPFPLLKLEEYYLPNEDRIIHCINSIMRY